MVIYSLPTFFPIMILDPFNFISTAVCTNKTSQFTLIIQIIKTFVIKIFMEITIDSHAVVTIQKGPMYLLPSFPNGNILQNYLSESQPGY